MLWYLTCLAIALGYGLDAVMQANTQKLRKRYPDGFTTKASIDRVDVAGAGIGGKFEVGDS